MEFNHFEIEIDLFLRLYDKLLDKLVEKELNKIYPAKMRGDNSGTAILVEAKAGEKFYGFNNRNDKYLFRLKDNANTGKAKGQRTINIDTLTLSKVLAYLGYHSTRKSNKRNVYEDVKIQFSLFCEDFEKPFLNQDKKAEIFRMDSQAVVKEFYRKVSLRQFETAWFLISEEFKKRIWNDRIEKFIEGYFFLRSISKVSIFNPENHFEDTNFRQSVLVYYETDVDFPVIEELISLRNLSIKDKDKIPELIDGITDKLKELGINSVDRYNVGRLFRFGVVDHIWFTSNIDPRMLTKSFDFKSRAGNPNLVKCVCVTSNEGWKIDRILPIST